MGRVVEFRRTLDKLFHKRAHWLMSVPGQLKPGAPPKFSRRARERTIRKLQGIASAILATKLAKAEFRSAAAEKKKWRVKGRGDKARKQQFSEWFEKGVPYRSFIYVFWKKGRCIYVGKTRNGAGHPTEHFEKKWFNGITRIDLYGLRGRRSLPALECLAIHRFQPVINKNKAQTAKWTTKCPLCEIHKGIESELRSIFALR